MHKQIKNFIEKGEPIGQSEAPGEARRTSFFRKNIKIKAGQRPDSIKRYAPKAEKAPILEGKTIEEPYPASETEPATTKPSSVEELLPYTADEIVPMVKVARQHGDSFDTIKSSLTSAGYNPSEVDKAIEKAKKN